MSIRLIFFFFIFLSFLEVTAATENQDTVILKNKHVVIGEIKTMDNGILTIKTDYSERDFQIEWNQVESLSTETSFIILLSNKYRVNGTFTHDKNNPEYLIITPIEGSKLFARIVDIVYLKSNRTVFWDRLSAGIDGGITVTKASDQVQFSFSGNAAYLYTKFKSDVYFDLINNRVNDDTTVIKTNRNNWGGSAYVYFNESWFIMGASDFLQNSEQNLSLRTTLQNGIGKFLIYNHYLYLTSSGGIAWNNEQYNTKRTDNTTEIFGQMEFNGYNFKDFEVTSKLQIFPSIKFNRFRSVFLMNVKFDLPYDFYIGGDVNFNYDSSPGESTSSLDYVIKTSFGWSF